MIQMFFSVIVPIYKVEHYLVQCIESVLCQSFSDFELILVDDGSPDGCPEICDRFAEKDMRIKTVHKENGGLVSARQAGLRIASGKYIFNLDGDDALLPDALEMAHDIIETYNADIVSFSYIPAVNGVPGEKVEDMADEGFYDRQDITDKILSKIILDENMKHIFYFSWGKAIKRELLMKPQLDIDKSISLGEDLCCTAQCFINAESAYMSRKAAYLYTIRSDSLTNAFNINDILKIEAVVKYLKKIKTNVPPDMADQIARYSCFMCFVTLAAAAENNRFAAAKDIKRLISKSVHKEEIARAEFKNLTPKSKIAVAMIKKNFVRTAFWFLYFCKIMKGLGGGK